jgi:hypothetical protein
MDINGYTFYTMAQDKDSVYRNSGVRVQAVVEIVMMMMTRRQTHIMVK